MAYFFSRGFCRLLAAGRLALLVLAGMGLAPLTPAAAQSPKPKAGPKPAAGGVGARPTAGSGVRIVVTFASAPATATARLAPTLYNKSRVLHFELDDSPVSAYTEAYPIFKGGAGRNGQRYRGLHSSDGCGNARPWTAAVAINGHNTYNNAEWLAPGPGHDASKLVWSQAQELLTQGWDIENHSDLHTGDNPAQQLSRLHALIGSRLRGYQPAVLIVPTNHAGYCKAAFAAGYAAASSAGQGDGLPLLNPYTDQRIPLSSLPAPAVPFVYRRYNADLNAGSETPAGQLTRLKGLSDALLAPGAEASEVYLQRVFSHGLDAGVLAAWLSYTQQQARDRLWVTTLREFAEYRRTSSQVVKTETLSGNTLTITLNYAKVSPGTRFQNLTLLIDSPGTITGISVSGAGSSSNPAAKLVNVLRP